MFTMLAASSDLVITHLMTFWAGFFMGALLMFFIIRGQYLKVKETLQEPTYKEALARLGNGREYQQQREAELPGWRGESAMEAARR